MTHFVKIVNFAILGVVKMRDKIFKPIHIHTANDYLSDAVSEKAVSIKVPEI